ncbi:MAG: peptidylprolyl isomerase [Acidobacteriota bacterium]
MKLITLILAVVLGTSLVATHAQETAKAPDLYKVKFVTTKGDFIVEVHRDWAPNGADRFYQLIQDKYYDGLGFFRVVKGFMVQFGVTSDETMNKKYSRTRIPDDPVKAANERGMITYAMGGPNTRTTQVFINFGDNKRLDGMGFAPFGKVVSGMLIVDKLYAEYGDMPSQGGKGPDPGRIASEGSEYLKKEFPRLDFIKTAQIVP